MLTVKIEKGETEKKMPTMVPVQSYVLKLKWLHRTMYQSEWFLYHRFSWVLEITWEFIFDFYALRT